MDLLTNATSSIKLGVEDYLTGESDRMLSAVRNVHAGILLLYKEALRRKSPKNSGDVLVKAQMRPELDSAGELVFVGIGKKTVDVNQIRERFSGLGITTRWELLDKITEARNDLEHYIPKHSQAALEGLIANALTVIRDFVTRELGEDPLQVLGEATWQAMLDVSAVYEEELAACQGAKATIDWKSCALRGGIADLSCLECGSDLLRPTQVAGETILECSRCGVTESPDSYVPKAIKAALDGEAYSTMKNGGDEPFTACPECGEDTYVMSERKCALCQESAEHSCERCGCEIPASEMASSPLCGYCQYMQDKMLDE
jgi:hypothetical protein